MLEVVSYGDKYPLCHSFIPDPDEDRQTEDLTIDDFDW